MQSSLTKMRILLLAGDILGLVAITLLGFASHDELAAGKLTRMLATFLPFLAAWLMVAPWLGLYSQPARAGWAVAWRTPLAALLAAPLGGWLRGLVLAAPILPVFVLVMAAISALVLSLWRLAAVVLLRRFD